jgi:hypothetical protein
MRNCALLCAIVILPACKTASKAADGVKSAGSAVAEGAANVTTSLVNVDLSNVLNDVAVKLNIDKSNIPINAQIPISIAANVCGVSINILSIGGGGSSKGCTATTASPELIQAIQQQLAAQGSVGGGAQTNTGTSGTTTQPAQPQPTTTQPPAPDPSTSTPQ